MILGFKKRFVPLILIRSKKHTIREDQHNRWKAGIKIHMATGVRTKDYKCFNDKDTCKSTQEILISWIRRQGKTTYAVYVDWICLSEKEVETLAINDGFESIKDFLLWFNDDFQGKIIHWTDLRY